MSFSSWLRSCKNALPRLPLANPPRRSGKKSRGRRLNVEALEDRTLMTAGMLDPTAAIALSPDNSNTEGALVTMTASAVHLLSPNSADAFTYAWTVTKNGSYFDSGINPAIGFTPDDNGSYVVSVTATDSGGATSIPATAPIVVSNLAPTAFIWETSHGNWQAFQSSTVPVGIVLDFNGYAYDSPADTPNLTYAWSFTKDGAPYALPDGTVTNLSALSFTPTAEGDYAATLVVTDKDNGYTSVSQAVTVTSMNTDSLQQVINAESDPYDQVVVLTLQCDSTQINSVTSALATVFAPVRPTPPEIGDGLFGAPVRVTLDLASGQYADVAIHLQPRVTLVINGGGGHVTFVGGSPALIVDSGDVIIQNVTFQNATDAPTILVTGGSLTLANDTIQESTGYSQAAISITGGTVDLGTTDQPGGNTININGSGALIQNSGSNPVSAIGNTVEKDGAVLAVGGIALGADMVVYGTAGNDTMVFTPGISAGQVVTTVNGIEVARHTPTGSLIVHGGAGNDSISAAGLALPVALYGDGGNDTLTGGSGDDVIFGGAGDDTITGGAGNDFLIGGTGKDRIVGSAGNDILAACEIDAALGLAALRGISFAWASSRTVTVEAVDDFLAETLGDTDSDSITGGAGADLFIINSGDMITDFQFGKPKTNKDGDIVIKDGIVTI